MSEFDFFSGFFQTGYLTTHLNHIIGRHNTIKYIIDYAPIIIPIGLYLVGEDSESIRDYNLGLLFALSDELNAYFEDNQTLAERFLPIQPLR